MKVRGGEFSTGTMRNFQPELTLVFPELKLAVNGRSVHRRAIHRILRSPLADEG